MKKILILGSYGQSNAGDEEILSVFLTLFKIHNFSDIYVNSSNPRETSSKFNVKSFSTFLHKDIFLKIEALFLSSIYFFGGGNVLIEHPRENLKWYQFPNRALIITVFICILGRFMNKKIIFANIGIGPLRSRRSRLLARLILKLSDLIIVRDRLSKKLAEDLSKKKIILSSDIVLVRSVNTPDPKNYIILFPNWHIPVSKKTKEKISLEIVRITNYFYLKGIKVILIPLWSSFSLTNDLWYSEKLLRMGAKAKIIKTVTTGQIMSYIKKSNFCISMRLHGAIFSSLCRTPFVALNYNPKVGGFVDEINESYLLQIKDFNYKNIIKIYRKLSFDKNEFKNLTKLRKMTKRIFLTMINEL